VPLNEFPPAAAMARERRIQSVKPARKNQAAWREGVRRPTAPGDAGFGRGSVPDFLRRSMSAAGTAKLNVTVLPSPLSSTELSSSDNVASCPVCIRASATKPRTTS